MAGTKRSPDGVAPDASPTHVDVQGVSKYFGDVHALREVDLLVGEGAMVALLGPSGCGKTTLLRVIAGLERPDGGTVQVGDRVVTSDQSFVAPEHRRVGMVFQDWALFPHLSVDKNVAYGLPRLNGDERRARVDEVLALVGLEAMGDRSPGTLSGGQQQRVALARALAPRPSVLLLDEPFSNLDTARRVQVRTEVHRLLAGLGVTTVFVTHDQEEAFVLGDQVAVMDDGRVVQQATPAELYRRPATRWVASFVGDANLLPGAVHDRIARTQIGAVPVTTDDVGRVEVLVRPEAVRLAPGAAATVELVEFYGHDTVYLVRMADGMQLRSRQTASPQFTRGDLVDVSYAGDETVVYDDRSSVDAADGS